MERNLIIFHQTIFDDCKMTEKYDLLLHKEENETFLQATKMKFRSLKCFLGNGSLCTAISKLNEIWVNAEEYS